MKTHLASHLLLLALAGALVPAPAAWAGRAATPGDATAPELPPALRRAYVQARMQEAGPEYHFAARDGQFLATHPEQSVHFRAGAAGVQIQPMAGDAAGWSAEVRIRSLGRDGADGSPAPAALAVRGNRVEYARPGLTEWYLSGPLGLEQGFTLSQRPAGDGPLVITVGFGDRLEPQLAPAGGLELRADGVTRLRYTDLSAKDAAGRPLAARMEVRAGRAALVIEDADARYPIEVDPLLWTEQQKLTASDPTVHSSFGYSAAMSGDTAVVGTFNNGAYVFVRSGADWVQQAKLMRTDPIIRRGFGRSVSLSGDTVVVADPDEWLPDGRTQGVGAAYVFVRSGTAWTQQQKLVPSTRVRTARFGCSVSVSGDTILAGASADVNAASVKTGAAYVFVRSGTTWTQQQKLLATDGALGDSFGVGVSVSGDTALVGAYQADPSSLTNAGAAYVFTRSGAAWSQQAKLVASDAAADSEFGVSVSVSGDTALVGADYADPSSLTDAGAAYVFVAAASSYSIGGTVTLGGAGLAGVTVSDGTRSDVTAGDGSYTLTGVPNGSYTVTPSLAGGYTFDPASRSVTVAGAAETGADFAATQSATVTLSDLAQTYDGTARAVTVTTDPANLTTAVTYDGAASAPTNAGSYTAVATVTQPGYAGSATNTLVIAKATPTATLAVNNSPVTYDGSAKAATVGVTTSSTPGAAANILTGGADGQTDAGTYAVTADFVPANTNFNTLTAQAAGNFVINKATPTATLVSSLNPSPVGASVLFTATVTPAAATGTVTFKDGASALGTGTLSGGVATFTTNGLSLGDHFLTAEYGGDAAYAASVSGALTQTVASAHSLVALATNYLRTPDMSLKIRLADIAWDTNGHPVSVASAGPSALAGSLSWDATYLFYQLGTNVSDSFPYVVSNGLEFATNTITVTVLPATGSIARTLTVTNSSATIKFFGIPGLSYDVQRATTLSPPDWATLTLTPLGVGADGSFTYTDTNAPSGTAYYRSARR